MAAIITSIVTAVVTIAVFVAVIIFANKRNEYIKQKRKKQVAARLKLYDKPCRVCGRRSIKPIDTDYKRDRDYGNWSRCKSCYTDYYFNEDTLEWHHETNMMFEDIEKRAEEYDFGEKCTAEFLSKSKVIDWEWTYKYHNSREKKLKVEKERMLTDDSPLPAWTGSKAIKVYTNGYKVLKSPFNHCDVIDSKPR